MKRINVKETKQELDKKALEILKEYGLRYEEATINSIKITESNSIIEIEEIEFEINEIIWKLKAEWGTDNNIYYQANIERW